MRPKLSESLEDYLETIHHLVSDQRTTRVKEIARNRGVKMASVTNAMRRLSKLGLIQYNRREYIQLTPEGERLAQRTKSRHLLLSRFFSEVLRTPDDIAETDSCAIEHYLSDESFDGLVRMFEHMAQYPEESDRFLKGFNHGSKLEPEKNCWKPLSHLSEGAKGKVIRIKNHSPNRQRLIDMGLLPGTGFEVASFPKKNQSMEIRGNGSSWILSLEEAAEVYVAQC